MVFKKMDIFRRFYKYLNTLGMVYMCILCYLNLIKMTQEWTISSIANFINTIVINIIWRVIIIFF